MRNSKDNTLPSTGQFGCSEAKLLVRDKNPPRRVTPTILGGCRTGVDPIGVTGVSYKVMCCRKRQTVERQHRPSLTLRARAFGGR
jgi:hypothetical protein